jgi:hypothetical protein
MTRSPRVVAAVSAIVLLRLRRELQRRRRAAAPESCSMS